MAEDEGAAKAAPFLSVGELLTSLKDGSRPMCSCPGEGPEPWDPKCVFHSIGHYHKAGCCTEEDAKHRHMTKPEFEAEFPLLFDETVQTGETWLNVEARRFPDGIGTTVTRMYAKDDDGGLCFDLHEEEIQPLIQMLFGVTRALNKAKKVQN